jgi:L-ascorbate metabolism protein UlaG (beta-lactamase superfamily)
MQTQTSHSGELLMNNQNVVLTLIDGPTLLIEIGGLRLLTDPAFDPPQSYDSAGVTIIKQAGPPVTPDKLGKIDAVLLSHDQHLDNLDRSGRAFLPTVKRVLTTIAGAGRLGGNAEGLAHWQNTTFPLPDGRVLTVTGTPARHGPVGAEAKTGDVIGFVLSVDGGAGIYISGDTVWFSGVAEVADRFNIRLAVLFTGAARPRGPFHITMNTNDAIEAAAVFKDAKIVAIHNHGWAHFVESQEDVVKAFTWVGIESHFQSLQSMIPAEFEL